MGTLNLSFTYNDDGIRTSKIVNGTTHTYGLNGSQIITEEWGGTLLVYLYDAHGAPIGMQYRESSFAEGVFETFWFEKNLQGDIVAVYDENGIKQISYTYDAWGNFQIEFYDECTYSDPVAQNPFLYREYYYDAELGMYYLQSRYYDPVIGRFINADGLISTGQGLLGYNMYAYCNNNPIMYADSTGQIAISTIILGIVAVLAVTALDHAIAANQPEDGYVAKRHITEDGAIIKLAYIKGNGFECDNNGMTLFDLEMGVLDIFYEKTELGHLRIDPAKVLHAKATAAFDGGVLPSVDVSALAAIYTSDFEWAFNLSGYTVTISGAAHLGAAGGKIEFDPDSMRFRVAPLSVGIIPDLGIDIDSN